MPDGSMDDLYHVHAQHFIHSMDTLHIPSPSSAAVSAGQVASAPAP